MKKVLFLSCCVFYLSPVVFSQEISQSVIASGGGIAKSNNLSLEWTLGEFAVESVISGKHLYTQGFHQPVLIVKSINSPPQPELPKNLLSGYRVQIAPNPVQSFINVYLRADRPEKFSLIVSDMSGRFITEKQVSGSDLNIRLDLGAYSSGIYLLDIRKYSGERLKAFKIVKIH